MKRFNTDNIETFDDVFKQLGMSIKSFSERFGIPYRTVQDWRNGGGKCPAYAIRLFTDLFDRELNNESVKDFLYGDTLKAYESLDEYEKERFLKLLNIFVSATESQRDRIISTSKEILLDI